jgi:hypothetical protein
MLETKLLTFKKIINKENKRPDGISLINKL